MGSDDKDRAKVIPSRTGWGSAYSLGEKFPFLLERRYGVRAYDYWCGYTIAQIELMVADQPVIIYPEHGEKKITEDKAKAITDAWEQRRKRRGGSYKEKGLSFMGEQSKK